MELEKDYIGFKNTIINDYPYSIEWDDSIIFPIFEEVFYDVIKQHSRMNVAYYSHNGKGILDLGYISHFIILAYRFANRLWKSNMIELAEAVYYSERFRGNIDLYYKAEIGPFFIPTHALATVMDCHATYGQGFKIYNGCHIGPFDIVGRDPSEWKHPVFGDFVTMLANSHVYGKSIIGNNVIISIGTTIINKKIPDNSIVMGTSPNLHIIPLDYDTSEFVVDNY